VDRVGEFGCDTFVTQHRSQRDTTFSAKADAGIYLGHDGRLNCAKVRMLQSGKVVFAKDVIFREGSFKHLATRLLGQEDKLPTLTITDPTPTVHSLYEIKEENEELEDAPLENDSEAEAQYEVEKIKAVRTMKGERQYQVKWVGYKSPTWESAASIERDVPESVKEFQLRSSVPETGRLTRRTEKLNQAEAAVSSPRSDESENDERKSESANLSMAATEAAWCL
jgi:Chromo (CHRromatin Organisation MOdifier) domain